ncbi:MAG: universal stress protein [Methanomicrobiales archaeon]|jgi:nucleotide-binding universal stress UspA family protein|nr:universal stress protein [Methanomicrobiales archaeon]
MYKKILVAVDGSPISAAAFRAALQQVLAWNAELHIVYVIETGLFKSIPADNTVEMLYSMLQIEGQNVVENLVADAERAGATPSVHFEHGHAGETIVSLAKEIQADLIVLGTHGKSDIDRLLLGSVTSFVIAHSLTSTLVVRS